MTLKEIRNAQVGGFKELKDKELLDAFGTVNVFKKELTDLEKDVKSAIEKRGADKTGFTSFVQETLSFASGDVVYSISPDKSTVYSLDISEDEFSKEIEAVGLNPKSYMSIKYNITQTLLGKMKNLKSLPLSITSHIKVTTQESLKFKSDKLGGK